MSATSPKFIPETLKFHQYFSDLVDNSPLTQREIASELGYANPNIITMFKQGLTKVPVERVPKLAEILGADPKYALRVALADYSPALLETIEGTLTDVLTENEREIVNLLREETHGHNPPMRTESQKEKVRELASDLMRTVED